MLTDGIIVVYKKEGMTSFDVIKKLKKITNESKIGHAGVLDKWARGILICGINKATKLMSIYQDFYKIYDATILFGIKTDTLDMHGNVIEEKPFCLRDLGDVTTILKEFIGVTEQEVPLYSNIKIQGKRLYKYACKKQVPILPKKYIKIYSIKLLHNNKNSISIRVTCSKGTYIRALARDIANRMNTVGVLKELNRIYSHPFNVSESTCIDNINNTNIKNLIKSVEDATVFLPAVYMHEHYIKDISSNKQLFLRNLKLEDGFYRVMLNEKLYCILKVNKINNVYKCINPL